jgi:hypothetical protein
MKAIDRLRNRFAVSKTFLADAEQDAAEGIMFDLRRQADFVRREMTDVIAMLDAMDNRDMSYGEFLEGK